MTAVKTWRLPSFSHKLVQAELQKIVRREVAKVARRLREHGLELELTEEACQFLIDKGTDEKFGARPLRRAIGSYLEDQLSERILRGEFRGMDRIQVTVIGEGEARALDFEASKSESTEPVGAGTGSGADASEAT